MKPSTRSFASYIEILIENRKIVSEKSEIYRKIFTIDIIEKIYVCK